MADHGKMEKVMHEFKEGELRSGSKHGPKVRKRKQAVAIALSEAREAGEKVPPKRKRRNPSKSYKRSDASPGYYDVMSDHMIEDHRNMPPAKKKMKTVHESMEGDIAGMSKSKKVHRGI